MNNESDIVCPYCGETNFIEVDITGGQTQTFTHDCEICCRPIEVFVNIDRYGNVSVDCRNDEGF